MADSTASRTAEKPDKADGPPDHVYEAEASPPPKPEKNASTSKLKGWWAGLGLDMPTVLLMLK
jgi:hypothetical protein